MPSAGGSQSSYFCLTVPNAGNQALAQAAIDLRQHFEGQDAGFRPMALQDVHVTVLFCGDGLDSLPAGPLDDLHRKLAGICTVAGSSWGSLSMQFAGLEFFPPAKRNLVVARFAPSPGLIRLRAAVVVAAAEAGAVSAAAIAAEGEWLPHATLGKLRINKADLAKLSLPALTQFQDCDAAALPVGLRLVGAPKGRGGWLDWQLPFFGIPVALEPDPEPGPGPRPGLEPEPEPEQHLAKLAMPAWKERSEATAKRNLRELAELGGCPAAVIIGDSMTERLVDPPPANFCGGVECRPPALDQTSNCFVFSAGGDKICNLMYRLELAAHAGAFASTKAFVVMCGINNILYSIVAKKKNWRKKAEAAAAALPSEIVAGLQSVVGTVNRLSTAGGRKTPTVFVCELLPVWEADCETFKAEVATFVNTLVLAVNKLLPTLHGCKVVQMMSLTVESYLPDCLHLSPAGNATLAHRLCGLLVGIGSSSHSIMTSPAGVPLVRQNSAEE
eukprot:SAG31_NODE_1927_length_6884_cov_2.706264_4_plen_500_part_00